eukprot:scaffold14440_cov143-Isochrysis_galbana.AAC.4
MPPRGTSPLTPPPRTRTRSPGPRACMHPHPPRLRLRGLTTLGFPGEGPLLVATYNINGSRGTLAAVLAQATQAKIDILLLQELHFYEDGEHGRVGPLADRQGWTLVHSPATLG